MTPEELHSLVEEAMEKKWAAEDIARALRNRIDRLERAYMILRTALDQNRVIIFGHHAQRVLREADSIYWPPRIRQEGSVQ